MAHAIIDQRGGRDHVDRASWRFHLHAAQGRMVRQTGDVIDLAKGNRGGALCSMVLGGDGSV